MERNFKEAIKNRRTFYSLTNKSSISDKEIEGIIDHAVLHVPSAFNSQSARIVLLLGENHRKLWDITKDTLKKIVPAEAFKKTEEKIDGAFASGHGTILYFEDQDVIKGLQGSFPSYADNFPRWSEQSSGMLQFAIWTMLEDAGMGASLQHYNPLIDDEVGITWSIPKSWKLISQMPFGIPNGSAGEKEFSDLDKRVLVFK